MKLTINKLIANDIINYGMDNTMGTNYIISLNEYMDDFDEQSKEYILNNLEEIENDIENNENVADLHIDIEGNNKYYDMAFYYQNLMNQMETIISSNAKSLKINLNYEDIKNISDDILSSTEFTNQLLKEIHLHSKEDEMEI